VVHAGGISIIMLAAFHTPDAQDNENRENITTTSNL